MHACIQTSIHTYTYVYTGNIDTNAVTFGNSWKLDPRCKDAVPTPPDPCEVQIQRAPIAEKKCNKLQMAPFSKCHSVINPSKYMKVCKHDVCACVDGEACLCDAIATYVHECAVKGVIINWRNENILPECGEYLFHCLVMKGLFLNGSI